MPQQILKGFKQILTQAESFLAHLHKMTIGLNYQFSSPLPIDSFYFLSPFSLSLVKII